MAAAGWDIGIIRAPRSAPLRAAAPVVASTVYAAAPLVTLIQDESLEAVHWQSASVATPTLPEAPTAGIAIGPAGVAWKEHAWVRSLATNPP